MVARLAALCIGAVAILLTLALGDRFNIAILVGLALSIAASANFPALVLCFTWRRFSTTGAVAGILVGLAASVTLIVLGPTVWPGGPASAPFPLVFPVLISIPAGFLGCWIGTVIGPRRADEDDAFMELHVRSMTGLGAEAATRH